MITEILINHGIDGKQRVVVYPTRCEMNPRVYVKHSEASCKRLERMMSKHNVRPYLRKQGLSIWIRR